MKAVKEVFCLGVFVLVLSLAACGKNADAPVTTSTPNSNAGTSPSGTGGTSGSGGPAPTVTVLSFIYQNSAGICNALRNWDPTTEVLFFPSTSAPNSPTYFSFESGGVFWANPDGTHQVGFVGYGGNTDVFIKEDIHGTVCTFTVTDGQFVGVN